MELNLPSVNDIEWEVIFNLKQSLKGNFLF